MTEQETFEVSELMTKNQLPCDAIWLDIEYTDDKRYFTWDKKTFPNGKKLLDKILSDGRKLITIVDPHIKDDPDYFVHKHLIENKLYVAKEDGLPYHGFCWPGQSIWIDFMNPLAREYVKSLYKKIPEASTDKENYIWTNPNVHIWNDMNEPACFDPYEKSMMKSNVHQIGKEMTAVEHRDVHNAYGYFNTIATYEGLIERTNG